MHRITLSLLLLACAFAAGATEPQAKVDSQAFAGACQAKPTDAWRLLLNPFWALNTSGSPATVYCAPVIDTSTNGTRAVWIAFGNTAAATRVVTCTGRLGSPGPGGPVTLTRSVILDPRGYGTIGWAASDLGTAKTFIGGPVGIECALPSGVTLASTWTRSVAN